MGLIVFMGWHREVTAENIVALRDRFHHVLAEHCVVSVLAYMAIYAALAALSLPGCPILTATGGLMFGWLVGGAAAVVGATTGATLLFLIARSAMGGMLSERAAPWLTKLRAGLQGGRAELSAVPAPCSGLSLLVRQHRAGRPRCSPQAPT